VTEYTKQMLVIGVDVDPTGDKSLCVFEQTQMGFDRNNDPNLSEKKSKVSCDTQT
jgi:hypothetical protein